MTSHLGGSAHKRGLVNPETGRILLYTYRDISLTFTVKVRIFMAGFYSTHTETLLSHLLSR